MDRPIIQILAPWRHPTYRTRKWVIIALALGLLFTHSAAAETPVNLKGPVKSVQIKKFRGIEKPGDLSSTVYLYGRKGNLVEETAYNSKGSITLRRIYVYDAEGKKIQEADYGSKGALAYRRVFTYASKGKPAEMASYDSHGAFLGKWIFSHDAKGNLTNKVWHGEKGLPGNRVVLTYDASGNKISEVESLPSGMAHKRVFSTNGSLIEEIWYDSKDSVSMKWIYTYDAQGNKTQVAVHDKQGLLGKAAYVYVFDDVGDWVKRTEVCLFDRVSCSNDKPEVIYRTITYYPKGGMR